MIKMEIDKIVDEEKVRSVMKEQKCPYCGKCLVVDHAGIEVGSIDSNGRKIPRHQLVNFECLNCGRWFDIPKAMCDKFK